MELELKNVGEISHAKIKLRGMTLLTGKNGTGKDTISNTLHEMLTQIGTKKSTNGCIHGEIKGNEVYLRAVSLLSGSKYEYYKEDFKDASAENKKKIEILRGKINGILSATDFDMHIGQVKERDCLKNVPSGIKTIDTIQQLVENAVIRENTILIIDEPETGLDQDLQVKLGEILVVLEKELNLRVLINTNSPYFIRSVECYCDAYNIFDNLNVYHTVQDKTESYRYTVENLIEQEHGMELLYYEMAKPFDRLQDMITRKGKGALEPFEDEIE